MPIIYRNNFTVGDAIIPYNITQERRNNIRMSIASSKAILRLPTWVGKSRIKKEHALFENWIAQQVQNNPNLAARFTPTIHSSQDLIKVMEQEYVLEMISSPESNNYSLKLIQEESKLQVRYPDDGIHRILPKLKSKLFSSLYIASVRKEVQDINVKHFGYKYNQVRLKYNKTNWGSCSSKGNINLSSRLLLVPKKIRAYVIIHELSHLQELNHSSKFWRLVASAMPLYKDAELWLKNYGKGCDF